MGTGVQAMRDDRGRGPNDTKEQRQVAKNHTRNSPEHPRTHQSTPEHTRTHREHTRSIQNSKLRQSQTRVGRARGTRPGALIQLQSPSDRTTHAGAVEISRFGLTPQPLIYRERYIYIYAKIISMYSHIYIYIYIYT